ncbi:MAG: hypothetical protein IT168_25615 [Bryobacterales bacterium]|nr:hypothetical protein [Bryobacterales bacterium]
MRLLLSVFLLAGSLSAQPPAWKTVYFHDEDQAALQIDDISFSPPHCVIATGLRADKGNLKPVAVVSSDGGEKWTIVTLKDQPRSIFQFDATHAWILAEKGTYSSSDCGATWTRLSKREDLLRIYFTSPDDGFAVGLEMIFLQTHDGGKTWQKVTIADPPKANPERSALTTVTFAGNFGLVTGFHQPRRPDDFDLPDWMDPAEAKRRRQWPSLTFILQTIDAGKTWKSSAVSLLGKVSRVRVLSPTSGAILIEFDRSFEFPSEVYRLAQSAGKPSRMFRDKTLAATDVALFSDFNGLVAGYAPVGQLHQLPIPGKVRIQQTTDGGVTWTDMDLDYRAVAKRVILAYGSTGPVFAATDTGMILRLPRP